MTIKLSPAQRRVLDNLASGKPAEFGLRGRSQHGGFVWTMVALQKKELIDEDGMITEKGRTAIESNNP